MRHYLPVEVVHVMEKNSGMEAEELLLDLITLVIEIGNFDAYRSFDHCPNAWERRTVLPTELFVLKAC